MDKGEEPVSMFRGCPGAINIREVKPEYIDCPRCGEEVEIWSDERTALCSHCRMRVSREQAPSCIDWCAFAQECIGTDKYQRLTGNGPAEGDVS